jgi:hypothetical protein
LHNQNSRGKGENRKMEFKKEKEVGKKTVFLIQENPYINVLSAQEYGDIVLLFESGQQIMFSPQPAIKKLRCNGYCMLCCF